MTDASSEIGPKTRIQTGLLSGILTVAIIGTYNATRWMGRVESAMAQIPFLSQQLAGIQSTITDRMGDRWTESDMRWYVDKVRELNQGRIDLPDILRRP